MMERPEDVALDTHRVENCPAKRSSRMRVRGKIFVYLGIVGGGSEAEKLNTPRQPRFRFGVHTETIGHRRRHPIRTPECLDKR